MSSLLAGHRGLPGMDDIATPIMVPALSGSTPRSGSTSSLEHQRRLLECSAFYAQPELGKVSQRRVREIMHEFDTTGRYEQTLRELAIGAKLAWRNHARCVGRNHWRTLKVLDARQVDTADELAEACWQHLRLATNGGSLQSVITIGPLAREDGRQWRIVSPQLIRYAGYRHADGTVTGDPLTVDITEQVTSMGWRGAGTPFDILPVLICTPDEPLRWFDVPADCVLEVPLEHPDFRWFAQLGLKWHAVPAVSNMLLEVGGLSYPCAPFSGWYVSTEVGARNLSDTDRYNLLPVIAKRMRLDTRSDRTLWKDRALVELNLAVIHSYRKAGVIMVDHHTVAKQFLAHVERERRAGRSCPTDWSWINPPLSGSTTPTFHRLYDPPRDDLRPNFLARPTERSGYPVDLGGAR